MDEPLSVFSQWYLRKLKIVKQTCLKCFSSSHWCSVRRPIFLDLQIEWRRILQEIWNDFNIREYPLGPRQTSDFDEQYCDKTIFFFFVVWIENLNSWLFQLILKSNSNILSKKIAFVTKNIALSQYRIITLSQYCSSKSLVWRGPWWRYKF